jgi:predicted lipoprotein
MKLKFSLYLLFAALTVSGFISCSDDDVDPFTEKEEALAPIIPQYVNHTIIATYHSLAEATVDLYEAMSTLKVNKTTANLQAATQAWIATRTYWELSEAFLFGPASDFGIDPHIDTWPLDEPAFINTLGNAAFINSMNAEDGDIWAADHLGVSLLGFHGIEYILFKEGKPKAISDITTNELIYATAVAGDLRNQCIRLETAWAEEDEISGRSYGEEMLNAGKAGSSYRTITQAATTIVQGCIDIADEVGEVKIGTAYGKDDVNYIESPYSFNSKVDFVDNIKSIENAYLGGVEGHRGASLSQYIKDNDVALDSEVKAAITNAIAKINAIPYPFAINYGSAEAGAAIGACQALSGTLSKVKAALEK